MYDLTEEQAADRWGPIIAETFAAVVRLKDSRLVIHRKNHAGAELLPNGYITGGNVMHLPEATLD